MKGPVNVHYAKTHLSALLKRVREGQTIIISHDGTPVARLVPIAVGATREPGGLTFTVGEDFLAPLSEAELDTWEG